jgi:hypothetical protein
MIGAITLPNPARPTVLWRKLQSVALSTPSELRTATADFRILLCDDFDD